MDVVPLAAPLMSMYTVPGAFAALKRLGLPDDQYIIGVTYRLEDCVPNATGDSQLFVTGTVANRETPAAACVRELCEEVMMRPKALHHIHHTAFKSGDKCQINWYSCKVTDLEQLTPVRATRKVDSRNKVSCILHGTYEEVLDLFGRIPLADEAGDGIVGLVAMRAGHVDSMLNHIAQNYTRGDLFFWYHNGSTEQRPRPARDIYAFSGCVLPVGTAATIRRAIETMGPILGDTPNAAQPYCEDMECFAPTAANSIYCRLHRPAVPGAS